MISSTQLDAVINGETDNTAKSLRKLYYTRAAFSISWVIIVSLFAKGSLEIASILLIIYPAWDVFGTGDIIGRIPSYHIPLTSALPILR